MQIAAGEVGKMGLIGLLGVVVLLFGVFVAAWTVYENLYCLFKVK